MIAGYVVEKVQVVLDEAKIRSERQFSYDKMQQAIDGVLVGKYGLEKAPGGFYLGSGSSDDYSKFWLAILKLKDQPWFLDNVNKFLWFNSDDSGDPDDFIVEDLREHYLAAV